MKANTAAAVATKELEKCVRGDTPPRREGMVSSRLEAAGRESLSLCLQGAEQKRQRPGLVRPAASEVRSVPQSLQPQKGRAATEVFASTGRGNAGER